MYTGVDMASELISFRLSNTELEWLREQCEDGESLNLAAKRLLLSLEDENLPENPEPDTFIPPYEE